MMTIEKIINVKLISLGDSKAIEIPAFILEKYGFSDSLILEETEQGLLLRKLDSEKLSWEETYQVMAQEKEDWEDLDSVILDGLEGEEFDSEAI